MTVRSAGVALPSEIVSPQTGDCPAELFGVLVSLPSHEPFGAFALTVREYASARQIAYRVTVPPSSAVRFLTSDVFA